MTRLRQLDVDTAPEAARPLLEGVRRKRGTVTPLFRGLGNSPAALGAYVAFGNAMAGSALPDAVKERIAIAIAAANGCEQCLGAHTRHAREAGVPDPEVEAARGGASQDPLAAAALAFSRALLATRGHVPDADMAAAREAGLDDGRMVEVAALVAINLFTNYVNNLAKPAGPAGSAPG